MWLEVWLVYLVTAPGWCNTSHIADTAYQHVPRRYLGCVRGAVLSVANGLFLGPKGVARLVCGWGLTAKVVCTVHEPGPLPNKE